jgi:tellurite resistance protein TerC
MQLAGINVFIWIGFLTFVGAMLALDLGVFNRKSHKVEFKEAGGWSAVWIALSLVFNGLIFWKWADIQPGSAYGNTEAGLKFLTGYVIEKALSIDNIFVFIVVFKALAVPEKFQHRVLFYGVLGALVFRAIFIAAGAALLTSFAWLMVPFGLFLILTGIKLWANHGKEMKPLENPAVKWLRQRFPFTEEFHGEQFWILDKGRRVLTPLFLALVVIEVADLVFAIDSVPAVFAVTEHPFLVFTSNIFAILGLRSLYFALAGFMDKFHMLGYGLAAVLAFVGFKMVWGFYAHHIPVGLSLLVIVGLLTVSVVASLLTKPKHAEPTPPAEAS